MSWSIQFVGAPEKVKRAVEEASKSMSGASKEEYETVKPHLVGLVEQIVPSAGSPKIAVSITASGSASIDGSGKKTSGSCTVDLKQIYGLVE